MALETLDTNAQNQTGTVTVQGADTSQTGALDTVAPVKTGATDAIAKWYQDTLGRQADIGGLNAWSTAFGDTLDPTELATLNQSQEAKNRAAVTNLYQTELGRQYDQPGYDYWIGQLNAGKSLDDITKGFNQSTEGTIYDIYNQELGRAPDVAGAQNWSNLLTSGKTPAEIRAEIAASEEGSKYDIGSAYKSELGRPATAQETQNWYDTLVKGSPIGDITKSIGESEEGRKYDIAAAYKDTLGRTGTPEEIQSWYDTLAKGSSFDDVLKNISASQEATVVEDYRKYLGREPDAAGLADWISKLQAGIPPIDIAKAIALSDEGLKTATTDVTALLNATLGEDLVKQLTPDQIKAYASQLVDPSSAAQTGDARLKEIYKQIALDPVMGAKLKESNPYLYESVTPLQQGTATAYDRGSYGQYGMINGVPILNGQIVDSLIHDGNSVSDFSHGRLSWHSNNLGWSSNSYSDSITRGADVFGITKQYDGEGNFTGYTGNLNDAAKLLGIDQAQFKDKQVPTLTTEQRDEIGNIIQKAGQPTYQQDSDGNWITDKSGNRVEQTHTVTAQDQLYDAVNNAAQGIYSVTMDSMVPGAATEGGANSFQTVLYKREGDKLIPITAPQSHGGQQNWDVYHPSHGFMVDSGMIEGAFPFSACAASAAF